MPAGPICIYAAVSNQCCPLLNHFKHTLFMSPTPGICADTMSSIKPEEHNLLKCCQMRTKPRQQEVHNNNVHKKLAMTGYQIWNWVTGSMGHLSRPGHQVIILTQCETRFFPVLEKMPVHLKCSNDKSHCPVSVVGLKSLDVSPCNELLLLPMNIKNSLA